MQLSSIYDALFAGQTLAVELPTLGAVHTFRAKLYRYKKQQDAVLLAVEMIDERQQLSISERRLEDGTYHLTLKLEQKQYKEARSYKVTIIEEEQLDGPT
jgi:hypothetical protein